jgi:tRNA pseudouridine32 synthase/23S rRNA pseudouridine746 synthase
MFDEFDKNKYIYPGYSTETLLNNIGMMFGILVCEDKDGNEVVLKAFSGQYCGSWIVPTFVEPNIDVEAFNNVVNHYDPQTRDLSKKIYSLDSNIDAKEISQLNQMRRDRSSITLAKLIDTYSFPTINNETYSLKEIVKNKSYPSGTGDCCAPKLLGSAFRNNLQPISLAEGFYGLPTRFKEHKKLYPPCKEKCSLILPTMLNLEILYSDDYITVVNKEAGLPTIPGRAENLKDCVTSRLKKLYPSSIEMSAAHRLDMDTSGIIVLGRTKEAHRNLSIQFQNRSVKKEYIAVVRGIVKELSGVIDLPLRLDVDNRPTQIVDKERGKSAKTEWTRITVSKYKGGNVSRLLLKPYTGRTHQLRVHTKEMLYPIVGDRLYGERTEDEKRMLLHASYLEFDHPITGERMSFTTEPDF